jgi:DNA topoisomerase-1
VVAEFTNEGGKSFKAKLPKNFNTKKRRKILNKNIGSPYMSVFSIWKRNLQKITNIGSIYNFDFTTRSSKKTVFAVGIIMKGHNACMKHGLITYMRTG